MTLIKYRGRRVRPHDQNLILHEVLLTTLLSLSALLWLNYAPLFQNLDLATISWPLIKQLPWTWHGLINSLELTSLLMIVGFSIFIIKFADTFQAQRHRQKLARMFIQNNWFQQVNTTNTSFFKDWPSNRQKNRISHFPKIYYRMRDGLIHIQVEITVSNYQTQLLHLESRLESGLFCELVDKTLHDSFVEYTLLYDTIARRITIDEVVCQSGQIQLMQNVWWQYDHLPHMLIAGGTGGGKTFFILTLIKGLLEGGVDLTILDPKNADLADLATVLPNVYYESDKMIHAITKFHHQMLARNRSMKTMPSYHTGNNYADLGLTPHFLIFDEYVAFMDMIGRQSTEVMDLLKQIVMLGRQSGFFIILACQRPDAKYLGDGIRDQFMFRLALGRMSALGYTMMFGDTDKEFFNKPIKGRGYLDTGTNVISEFYTPKIPAGYNFIEKINNAYSQTT